MKTTSSQKVGPCLPYHERHRLREGWVFSLNDERSSEISLAGGKGAVLSSLAREGFPVPDALIISSAAYEQFVAPARDELRKGSPLRCDDSEGLAAYSRQAQETLRGLTLPGQVREELRFMLSDFAPLQRFAVRSSATLEDLADAAFAGMHDTFLNCRGLEELLDRIQDCYLSLWSERAISYRLHKGFQPEESKMAVVVQAMLDCSVAGVGFSAHPVTGNLRTMVINAMPGLGESVVNGEHEVDHIEIEKRTGTVTQSLIGNKSSRVICKAAGGIEVEQVSSEEANAPCLAPWQLEQLSALMLQIEQFRGFPQDVEWGFADGALHLLQARTITVIPPRWTRDESAERFPNAITPLSWDILDAGFHRSLDYSFKLMGLPAFHGKWFASHHHYVYGDQNAVDLFLGRPPFRMESLEDLRSLLPELRKRYRWVQDLPVIWTRDLDRFLLEVGRLSSVEIETTECVHAVWDQIADIIETGTEYFLPNIAISVTQAKLYQVLHRLLAMVVGPEEAPEVFGALLAFSETRTSEINRELYDLASEAAHDPRLEELLHTRTSKEILNQGELRAFPTFAEMFHALVDRNAHRETDFDPYHATWGETPWVVLDHVRLIVGSLADGVSPIEQERQLRIRMLSAETSILDQLPEDLHYCFREIVRLARLYTSLDDREHFQTTRLTPPLRRALRVLGSLLADQGYLKHPMDVFFARLSSLREAVASDNKADWESLAAEIVKAKQAYQQDARRQPAWELGAGGANTERQRSDSNGPVTRFRGIPASPGTVEGKVHHVRGPEEFATFPRGAILVARTTNPAWTPLFHAAAGVITESGGPLSHGAVTAREMGIPAVMSVRDALVTLPDGQGVRLDGVSGEIELL